MIKPLIFILILLSWGNVMAQEDISKYLDDGNISTSKHWVKTNLTSFMFGRVDFGYEYFITDKFSIELGAGIQLPYYHKELGVVYIREYLDNIDYPDENPLQSGNSGYNFSVFPKIKVSNSSQLFSNGFQFDMYYGYRYKQLIYNQDGDQYKRKEYTIHLGATRTIGTRVELELTYGIGYANIKLTNIQPNVNWDGFLVPIEFKICYIL